MLDNINPEDILFLDIETVSRFKSYHEMPPDFRVLWDRKAQYLCKGEETPSGVFKRSGIYAEFGKIICISTGSLKKDGEKFHLTVRSFFGDDEKEILNSFCTFLTEEFSDPKKLLCAHNGKEFDFPYMARRMLVNDIRLPPVLNIAGKKPWEIRHLDTMELWKFGDYKNYTSLNLLAAIFNIPTPKDDIDGSMVYQVYWDDKDLTRIEEYCRKDVITIARLLLRYQGKPMIEEDFITFAS